MKGSRLFVLTAWIVSVLLLSLPKNTTAGEKFQLKPTSNKGVPWRVAYIEGGPYANYYNYLHATIRGLMELGWIEEAQLPKDDKGQTDRLWDWLSKNENGPYLRFVSDAYYTANWDEEARRDTAEDLIDRLNNTGDIDLIIAMGTWAGKDLANNRHHTPTVIMSTSDPVGSGIIQSVDDSGFDHVHARVDPYRYERQIRIFHELTKFRKLGIAFEDSVFGRTYAAIERVEQVAKERSFQVVPCYTKSDIANQTLAGDSVKKCFSELAPVVDAIYVTRQGGVNPQTIPELVEIANKYRIPTFSQSGPEEVRKGFLMSISNAGGFQPAGRFFAVTIAQICNGAKPRQLNQLFEESPLIAINLKTAEIIGFYLHADLLAVADEIYKDIDRSK